MINNYYSSNFKEQRLKLVKELRNRGIDDENVLYAISILPREKFVLPTFINRAYEDIALPIECNQTISQPYTVAYMTSELKVKKGDKILEIGTGSGYQACLLAIMGAKVFTIERIPELYEKSKKIFQEFRLQINTRLADGTLGWREFAPYDGIIVTAAAPKVPNTLKEQLAIGGRLVIPIGDKISQTMHIITRINEEEYDEKVSDRFKFVPLIGKEGWSNDNN
ncbi:MAG: protein-L-isoaspartate(D-aspartate) O-methyltransferase [Candidatus Kapabacteria bacterium]|nr:protein-L-isoaspartate(D-aspartate) O-methyltransferase [Candidatus Kapabacteria bacterium]